MNDDAEPDDPQLQALRAVWLAMPDEDPPERGLAELMAAARAKAETLTKPTLWQRIVACSGRPAVLALAGVLALIGGAVVIGERRDELEISHPAATAETSRLEERLAPRREQGSPALEVPIRTGAAGTARPPEPTAVATPTHERTLADPPAEGAMRGGADGATLPPARKATRGTAESTRSLPAEIDHRAAVDVPASEPARAHDNSRMQHAPPARAEGGLETAGVEPSVEPPGVAAASRTEALGASSASSARQVEQAKLAAGRGDCKRARELMKRVAEAEPARYRKAIAGDAALKKCVE